MATVTYKFFSNKPIRVSRFRSYKREADRDARWMRRHGGKNVKVSGSRGSWLVSAMMPLGEFAHFCVIEAAREASSNNNQ